MLLVLPDPHWKEKNDEDKPSGCIVLVLLIIVLYFLIG